MLYADVVVVFPSTMYSVDVHDYDDELSSVTALNSLMIDSGSM